MYHSCNRRIKAWKQYRKNKRLGFPKRDDLTIHPDWEMYREQQAEEIEAMQRDEK